MTEMKIDALANSIKDDNIEKDLIINNKLNLDVSNASLPSKHRTLTNSDTNGVIIVPNNDQDSKIDSDTKQNDSIRRACMMMNISKAEYLTYDELIVIRDMYTNHIGTHKIQDVDPSIITSLKDMIRVKFINRNIEHIDNLFLRLAELNVTDGSDLKGIFMKVVAIYIGNKDTIMKLFRKNVTPKSPSMRDKKKLSKVSYHPSAFELRLLLDKLSYDDQELDHSDSFRCFTEPCERISQHKNIKKNNIGVLRQDHDLSRVAGTDSSHDSELLCKRLVPQRHIVLNDKLGSEKIEDAEFMESIIRDIQHKTDLYSRSDEHDKNKTYVSDIKIAVFRLIAGVAYRSFRPNCSIDHTNLKKVRSDPYKFIDLIKLIKSLTILLKELGIVSESHLIHLTHLGDVLQDKYNKIVAQKSTNSKIVTERNNGYLYGRIEAELNHSISNIQKIDELKKYDISVIPETEAQNYCQTQQDDAKQNVNYSEDLKTRVQILNRRKSSLPYIAFKNRYSPIIVEDHDEFIPNALIKNAFWYDEFLPMLLRGLSIESEIDDNLYKLLDSMNMEDNDELNLELNRWFEDNQEVISTYCRDITESFDRLTLHEKIIIKQCWDMTKFYLIDQGKYKPYNHQGDQILIDISQYIPFIDEYLGTRYVMDYDMTPSLPQYIGPPVWKFLHAIPELMEHRISKLNMNTSNTDIIQGSDHLIDGLQEQIARISQYILNTFMDFFTPFLKTYPCPYCRNHLNNFVIKNSEIFNYPLEYIFMDWNESQNSTIFKLNIDDKMRNIKTTSDLRLFLWKFHNAVNSSTTDDIGYEIDVVSKKFNPCDRSMRSTPTESSTDVPGIEKNNADISTKPIDKSSESDSFDDMTSHELDDVELIDNTSEGDDLNRDSNHDKLCPLARCVLNTLDMDILIESAADSCGSSKVEKTIDEQLNEDMTNRSMNSRNGNYTDGHWPDPNIFDDSVKSSYNDSINQLIEHRKIFVSTIIETHNNEINMINNNNNITNTDQPVNHINAKIQDMADKIKRDISGLDKALLDSGILQNLYKVVDI